MTILAVTFDFNHDYYGRHQIMFLDIETLLQIPL